VIIWLYAHVVGLVYILLVCWFFFGAVCSWWPVGPKHVVFKSGRDEWF
jgi:hypothetical protein